MEHLGLIENRGIGPVKGAPNAWGAHRRAAELVQQAITVQTSATRRHRPRRRAQ